MNKIAVIIKGNPILEEFGREMESLFERAKERGVFLVSQLKNHEKSVVEDKKKLWNRLETYLEENELLPKEYNKNDHYLQWDDGKEVIFYGKNPTKGVEIQGLLKGLFDHLSE